MRIVFLHLSDLHLRNALGNSPIKIQAAVQSLSIFGSFEGIIIIMSGDIAATGSANEYKIAAQFLGRITDEIKKKYSINARNLKILVVPGNHDINYSGVTRPLPTEIREYTDEERKTNLFLEIDRMQEFLHFSDRNLCFFGNKMTGDMEYAQLVLRKILHFDDGYRVEVNLINSAPFSCDADDGLHFLPEDAILQVSRPSLADISILVMHHSPDWFSFSQRNNFEKIIAQRCSVVFYGHEHILGTQQITYDNGDKIVKQAGGAWWQQSNPTVSEYYAALFDTENHKYSLSKFCWDPSTLIFVGDSQFEESLWPKPLDGCSLVHCESYQRSLLNDTKHAISRDISDFFVFPNLKISASEKYADGNAVRRMDDLIAYISNNKYVAIVGGSNSGKTMLLKMLFKALNHDMTVLYCGTDDITGRSQENIIKELVRNTYGENTYFAFQQIPRTKKAIIIDDIHRIVSKDLKKFLRGIESIFETIIVATVETGQFDIVQMVKDNIQSPKEFKKLSIMRLYAEKRLEVITKVVSLKNKDDEIARQNMARILGQCLDTYNMAFRAEIDFVVQFSDYYCTHIGELDKADATVFSKVFEASIERAIASHLDGRHENVNSIVVALSEVAHYIHFNQKYPISGEHIQSVIGYYCEYYDDRYLTPARFIEILEKSNLLTLTPSGFEYTFKSKDHLAYFVAKALNRKFHDNNDPQNLALIVEQSCFGINGDILMFLTYISDNVGIPRLLLSQAEKYVQAWSEFDIENIGAKYLLSMPEKTTSEPAENQKEEDIKNQAREEELNDVIETLDIYDYDIANLDDLNYQLIRAFLQLRIIARSLSAFISILPAQDKQNLVYAMYQLPNKIFNQWSELVDNNINALIEDVLVWQESDEYDGKKLTREDVLKHFQDISLSMLLNLYHLVCAHGVNNSTVDYLSQQDYISRSLNYQLERLMFYEKVDDYHSVIREAERIFDANNDGMIRNMILAIVRHMFVYSDRITDRERRRLAEKYFSPQIKTRLLLDRHRARKENSV